MHRASQKCNLTVHNIPLLFASPEHHAVNVNFCYYCRRFLPSYILGKPRLFWVSYQLPLRAIIFIISFLSSIINHIITSPNTTTCSMSQNTKSNHTPRVYELSVSRPPNFQKQDKTNPQNAKPTTEQ